MDDQQSEETLNVHRPDRAKAAVMPDLNHRLQTLARSYARIAADLLGPQLLSVVLFGSVARGEARLHSDIDLFLVCRQLPAGAFQRQAVLEPVRQQLQSELEALWQQGCYSDFSEILKSEVEARHPHLLYLDMLEDGLILFDRHNFFAGILARLRARLQQLGSQRRQLGPIRYWDLKPDSKPGEVITL